MAWERVSKPDNKGLLSCSRTLHREALRVCARIPVQNTNDTLINPLPSGITQQIALSIKEQTKFLESIVNKRYNDCKDKHTKWSDLPDSMQNLIVMASSVDSNKTPNKQTLLYQ